MNPSVENDGHESPDRFQAVIEKLRVWFEEAIQNVEKAETPAARGAAIGLRNQIESAMRVLKICQKYRVHPGVHVQQIPNFVRSDHQPEIRVVDDGESDNPQLWKELEFENGPLRLHAGDLLISL